MGETQGIQESCSKCGKPVAAHERIPLGKGKIACSACFSALSLPEASRACCPP